MMNNENITLSTSTGRKLKKAGVVAVYFFGSRVSRNYFPFSDFDIGIVMEEKLLAGVSSIKLHNKIYDILSCEIPDKAEGPKLDISFLRNANPVLAMKAIREGKILFESNGKLRADFEEEILKKYDDYHMLQHEYEEANMRSFDNTI